MRSCASDTESEECAETAALQSEAAMHTTSAQAALVAAGQTGDATKLVDLGRTALAEYRAAVTAWTKLATRNGNPCEVYQRLYWLADAWHKVARIPFTLRGVLRHSVPDATAEEIRSATAAAVAVRDSPASNQYFDSAGSFVISLADLPRDIEYRRWVDTLGASGVEERTEVPFDGNDPATRNVVRLPIPPVVQASLDARDEYVRHAPPSPRRYEPAAPDYYHALDYRRQVAKGLLLYGHLDAASSRYEAIYAERDNLEDRGHEAWERLLTISRLARNVVRSKELEATGLAQSWPLDHMPPVPSPPLPPVLP